MGKVTSGSRAGQVEDPSGHLDDEAVSGPPGGRQAAAHGRARPRAAQRHLALGELHDGSGAQFATPVPGAGELPAVVQRVHGRPALDRRRERGGPVRSQGRGEQRPATAAAPARLRTRARRATARRSGSKPAGTGPSASRAATSAAWRAARSSCPEAGAACPSTGLAAIGRGTRLGGMRDSPGWNARLAGAGCATRGGEVRDSRGGTRNPSGGEGRGVTG